MGRHLLIVLTFLTLGNAATAQVGGPDAVPASLSGTWKVSLCIMHGHAWIRYQHVQTGEVHTVGRYAKVLRLNPLAEDTRKVQESGLQWDLDLRFERHLRQGRYLLLSVLVDNPKIPRGQGDGYGHGRVRNNCVTYARDAWAYYAGEHYPLPAIAAPHDLLVLVLRRHPEVMRRPETAPPAASPSAITLPLPEP